MTTTEMTNLDTEDQKYITARLCMMTALEIGKVLTLEEALILTDW